MKVHRLRLTYLDQGTWMPLWMRLWLPVGYVQNYTLYFQPCSASLYDEVQDTTNKATQKDMQYTLESECSEQSSSNSIVAWHCL